MKILNSNSRLHYIRPTVPKEGLLQISGVIRILKDNLRSKTFEIKNWLPWKYYDNLCVACELKEETMNHFLTCTSYENLPSEISWEQVKGNNVERQFEIARKVKSRQLKRKKIIENFEAGHPQDHPGVD